MERKNQQIPVFVHHETGEKKQAGKDKKQQYLKSCIKKATENANRVILFGDDTNKTWCNEWINVKQIHSERWDRFQKVHKNMSTYPDAWALGIFRRFFLFDQYALDHGIEELFVLDSDVLLYENISTICDWKDVDFAAIIPHEQQLGNAVPNDLRWTVNLGTSYWKTAALTSFLDYCIDAYTSHMDILQQKWDFHKKYSYPGGVCEMSLAYLWAKNMQELNILNLANPCGRTVLFNSDFNGSENYRKNEFNCNTFLNIKKVKFENGKPLIQKTTGEYVRVANLHFIGNTKLLMNDYAEVEHIRFETWLEFAAYAVKRHGGEMWRWMKRHL